MRCNSSIIEEDLINDNIGEIINKEPNEENKNGEYTQGNDHDEDEDDPNALGLIMSINSGSATDNQSNRRRYKKRNLRISVTSSMDCIYNQFFYIILVVEQGLFSAKNKLNTENYIEGMKDVLEVQVVNNFNLNCQKSSKKDNTNESIANNVNNIININFNNFEKTSANDRNLCFNCLTHDGVSPESNIAGEFYKKVCEEITLFLSREDNENRIKTSSICDEKDEDPHRNLNNKHHNKIKNFEELLDKYFTDLIYLIYFYFNSHCLVI